MNENDMNEMIKKAQYMIQNNQIPDDIKKIISNYQASTQNSNQNSPNNSPNYNYSHNYNNTYNPNNTPNTKNVNTNYNKNSAQSSTQPNSQNDNSVPNIDAETLMKLQSIMSKMKNSENDDMSKLLLSLKPYLRDGRKDKIDEYIQLIKMGKMTELFNSFGGDKK